MPQDGVDETTKESTAKGNPKSDWRDIFAVPEAVRRVFGKFPLVTYSPNHRPLRSPTRRDEHTLHVWTTDDDAESGDASFNPTCLKWQAWLKFCGIAFRTVASNNHASPTGILPFLLPSITSATGAGLPIPSTKLKTWAGQNGGDQQEEKAHLRAELYTSLIDHVIRRAWLYTLYLEPENFRSVAQRLYVSPASSNTLVNLATSHQLRTAAQDELAKTTPHQSAVQLLEHARDALAALSELLTKNEWFSGEQSPGLFDASVFAYTHLLLDERMGWVRNDLAESLRSYQNLVDHRNRIVSLYF